MSTRKLTSKEKISFYKKYDSIKVPTALEFSVSGVNVNENESSTDSIPSSIVFLTAEPGKSESYQLFIDYVPVASDQWSYNADFRKISWKGAFGGGWLQLYKNGKTASGAVGDTLIPVSIEASVKLTFTCEVATDCGATVVSGGNGVVTGFSWDTTSKEWTGASWDKKRLKLSYKEKKHTIGPPTLDFKFKDLSTDMSWAAGAAYPGSLQLVNKGGEYQWKIGFNGQGMALPDIGAKDPDSVFPWLLNAYEDVGAEHVNGVMDIDKAAPKGTLVGFQGQIDNSLAVGYYQLKQYAPFGVFDHQLIVNGESVADCMIIENELSWKNLSETTAATIGLPTEGTLTFSKDGGQATLGDDILSRLSAAEAAEALKSATDSHPQTAELMASQASASSTLDITDLTTMTAFAKDAKGNRYDVVQKEVRSDLSTMMQAKIPSNLWSLLYGGASQPQITGHLSDAINTAVPNVSDPANWYSTLATAVLSQGLAGSSDPHSKFINGPRASAWLRQEVTNSAVYQVQGQTLFQYHWKELYPIITQFKDDQINNASTYKTQIQTLLEDEKKDIDKNVVGSSTMKTNLKNAATDAANYAISNNLYWAFYYFKYNTAPSALNSILMLVTGSNEPSMLSRLMQNNSAVLTALDPSGKMAKEYNKVLNDFLTVNVLSNMHGFDSSASNTALIKEYLKKLVSENLNSQDKKIAAAANQIDSFLQSKDADKMIQKSIEVMRSSFSAADEALALPYVADTLVKFIKTNYKTFAKGAKLLGGVMLAGVTGLGIFNLVLACKDWSELNATQKAQIILNSVQIGSQVISLVVKKGVQVYSVWTAEGFTTAQRAASVAKLFSTGESNILNDALSKTSSNMARWAADTSGVQNEATQLMNIGANDEVEWTAKVFGRNLEEFTAARLGPLLIIAGMAMSIASIAEGENEISVAEDSINIAAGALTILAMVGEWAISAEVITGTFATVASAAGPLAVVAAVAGIGLLIYEMCQTPPNPIKEFVDNYASPAGFAVASQCSAIDYAQRYTDSSSIEYVGFTLKASDALIMGNGGSISLGTAQMLPSSVFSASTDGKGLSKISTMIKSGGGYETVFLSVMSDNSISFQPEMTASSSSSSNSDTSSPPTVVTQTWFSSPQDAATLDGSNLSQLSITLQPVNPDTKGHYKASNASGYLFVNGSNQVVFNSSSGTTLTLEMSEMAPNLMSMPSFGFQPSETPSKSLTYGSSFGVRASAPLSYSVTPALPSFLTLDTSNGVISPNGGTTSDMAKTDYTITATGPSGVSPSSASASFSIEVKSGS